MNPWVIAPYSVTPVASLLTRCVASGVLSQEDVDTVPREPHVFSPNLLEAEQHITMERELDKINLEMELLKLEKESADVTHKFYLSQRFTSLQQFTSHLQDVLREQASLRRRLMKPLCQTNLPIEADLHRYVVEVMRMAVDFIENLEAKMNTVRTIPTIDDSMSNLNNCVAQLLAQVTEVERLSNQVLQWRSQNSSTSINDITT
ncbi:HAUS augmin-like complex subunit 2 isoform X2 [Coregonus clupeaformis]|uniref:HAUS augmin-like complex subunit 2 n=2 Tax=Coregonus TaxID=27772 RepID=A0AAN8L8V9_9TELE|nr:HAUS augmin-like complex subunit 2 isoform X2 [Coregonus clupeaformis]XP_041704048.1 HAUS augmin-like complex subunit 2 isoform X2 [Coregonus clupeaformis]XP_041704049.1 HAUS augmin-like complex subunit 2 isoform X2 [Coregonus clupeaformis]